MMTKRKKKEIEDQVGRRDTRDALKLFARDLFSREPETNDDERRRR
jgi:hypothetical protein